MAIPAGQSKCAVTNAFDGFAPSPSAASSSAIKHLPYDVFINHRGPDVKDTLASSIYHSLNATGLRVFLDKPELELGDFLPTAIQEAMCTASVQIAIFSQNYARSPWCLAELAFMLDSGATFIPVFYHVQPDDLRWAIKGKGVYAHSFFQHELKSRYTSEQFQGWKRALHKASYYSGDIINNEVLKNVVNRVLKLMKKVPLEVAKHPVGLDQAVQEIEMIASQSGQSHDSAQIVGIWGMGGSGKTTLAKELYNRKCSAMERSSFLFDLRDAAGKCLLLQKQKKLLEDLGYNGASFDHVDEGKGILAGRLRCVSALIILDDVDHLDQLNALLPAKESLGRGSLVIVTTRELDVLRCWGISTVHKMRALNPSHAEQLFCWYAFLQPSPVSGFEDIVQKFVIACDSLPLSLKVLGAQLYGKSRKDYWVSQFHKICRILPEDIQNRLKLSYDALDKEEKEMFLDTACFFIGEENRLAIAIWDGSGWSGLVGWENLFNKCLVELGEDNRIRMHDHLRDLGRVIANQQSPYRLFSPKQIIDIQPQQKRIRIRGIVNATDEFPRWSSQGKIKLNTSGGFRSLKPSMRGMKILDGGGDFLNQEVNQPLKELVCLQCTYLIDARNLLSWPSLRNLRILKFYQPWQLKELWEDDADAPVQLIELVIDCPIIGGFPRSIERLKHLKYIKVFENLMQSLPEEFCFLQSLELLELKRCHNLASLPSRFGDLTNLRHLNLSECSKLSMLPVTFKQLTLLQYLNLGYCRKLTIESDILENMRKLEYLNFECCNRLQELPCHIADQTSLTELYLDATNIKEVPANIGQLNKLKILKLRSPLLTSLPTSLGNLSSLTELEIGYCAVLESLPESLGRLSLLEHLSLESTKVKYLPQSFTHLIHLQKLYIHSSPINVLSLGSGCKLKHITVRSTEVSKISISEHCCPCLKTLKLISNDHLMEVETPPTTVETIEVEDCRMLKSMRGIRSLANLQTLKIKDCPELDALPRFAELTSLKEFELKGCHKIEKIEGLEHLRSWEKFKAYSRLKEPCIVSLERSERLRELVVVANQRSVVDRCIHTIQKWPSEVIICTRAVCDVGSFVDFPNLSVLSFAAAEIPRSYAEALRYQNCNLYYSTEAIMICFIINCASADTELCVHNGSYFFDLFKTKLVKGKWVWMGVFTQDSCLRNDHRFRLYECGVLNDVPRSRNEVEAAWLVTGEEERLVAAFYPIFHTFTSGTEKEHIQSHTRKRKHF